MAWIQGRDNLRTIMVLQKLSTSASKSRIVRPLGWSVSAAGVYRFKSIDAMYLFPTVPIIHERTGEPFRHSIRLSLVDVRPTSFSFTLGSIGMGSVD